MYHSEYFCISKKQVRIEISPQRFYDSILRIYIYIFVLQVIKNEVQELAFTIPVHEPLPSQYVIRVISDRWLGSISQVSVSLNNIVLPELHPVQTGNFDAEGVGRMENSGFYSYVLSCRTVTVATVAGERFAVSGIRKLIQVYAF